MNLKQHLLVVAAYVVLGLLMTLPVVTTLATRVAGTGGDPWQAMWRFESEWRGFEGAQASGQILPWFKDTFLGGGEARLVNISVWPWMGLHVAFGEPVAYNLVWLLSYILSGYFMYLLTRHVTKGEAPAFLSGVLYMFLPFHVAHSLGHFGAMQTQWLPLAILLLFLFFEKPTLRRALGLGAVTAMQSWTEHHYLLWLGIFGVIFAIFMRRQWKEFWVRVPKGSLVWLLGVVVVFAVVPWFPTIRLAASGSGLSLGDEQTIRFSADMFSFITPPPWQPIWGGAAQTLFSKYFTGNVVEATEFLGFLPLLLFLFFQNSLPRQQKLFWITVGTIFFVISLGPWLHFFGKVLPVPLPYIVLKYIPVFSAVRAVARAGIFVGLSLTILFAWVLKVQLKRPISAYIILAGILVEFLFLPFPSESIQLSGAYHEVAGLPGKSLVEVPAATNYTVASQALFASLDHGKEVVGNIALERAQEPGALDEIKSLPGLRQLLFLRTDHLLEDRADFFEQDLTETLPDVLTYLDAAAITVRVDSLSATQREAVIHFLEEQMKWKPEKYDDVVLYRVQPHQSDGVFLARSKDWQAVGFDPKRNSTFGEIPRQASVTVYNVRPDAAKIFLEFEVEQGSIRVGDNVRNAGQTMRLPYIVPPGKTVITFESLLPGRAIVRNPKLITI